MLALHDISWHGPQLSIRWGVDEHRFSTSLWYESVDWDQLGTTFGAPATQTLAFHIAMFELNKGVSFRPDELVIPEPWSAFVTGELLSLWNDVVSGVWAQWRYEHDLPNYRGPAYRGPVAPTVTPSPIAPVASGPSAVLWFCGGGKDSLLTSDVLDATGATYDAFAYTHSVYGPAELQVRLLDRLVDQTNATTTHRVYVFDDALDLPLTRLRSVAGANVDYVLAAETPASVFASLPIALMHGRTELVVGHERSANAANLTWSKTGEAVNHQWGKSLAAERLLADYIGAHVVPDVRYYSVLAPVHDGLIFGALRTLADRLRTTHSCNVAKPWCLRCPKCAYVWISAVAWLPADAVLATFGTANLLDLPENQLAYRQMLGLEAHTPFECIGQVDEARLAFAMARARGLDGRAMRHFEQVPAFDPLAVIDRYLTVDHDGHRLPPATTTAVLAYFERAAVDARAFAMSVLGEAARIAP